MIDTVAAEPSIYAQPYAGCGIDWGLQMIRRLFAVPISVVMALALFQPPGQAATPTQWLPELSDSSQLQTPVVAGGVVRNSDGSAARKAQVTLVAWPAEDVVAGLQVGESVKLLPVAKATSDSAGRFSLRIPSLASVLPVASTDGLVDFEIDVQASSGMAWHSFSRRLVSGGSVAHLETTDAVSPGDSPNGAETVALQIGRGERGVGDGSAAMSDPSATIDKDACDSTKVADIGAIWDLVGQVYIATTSVSGSFVYTAGASSSLGVGYSVKGAYGSWSEDGTISRSSTTTQSYPAQGANSYKYFDTQFYYSKFHVVCWNAYNGVSYVTADYYEARPTSYVGGQRARSLSGAPSASYCTPYLAGGSTDIGASAAITWSNGLDISNYIGVALSTQTGYTASAHLHYAFSANRHLCGTAGYPGATPRIIVAKP